MTIDFYSILPLTCAIFVFFFGLLALSENVRSRMNQTLFGFCFLMLFWLVGTFMMFATRGDLITAVSWDRFVYAGVVFMPPLMHYFSLLLRGNIGKQKALLVINYFLSLLSLAAVPTKYFVDGVYYYSWGVHSQARILHTIFLIYFFIGTGIFFVNLWNLYRQSSDQMKKKQTLYVFMAFATVIFFGGTAYLYAYNIDTKFPFAYITGLIFPVMLFYAVGRHQLLGKKVVVTELLVGISVFLLIMQLFFSKSLSEIILRAIFSVVVAVMGILLIQSVRRDAERSEQLIALTSSLEKANAQLQDLDRQKTDFLSIAAHQLRTPISIASGYLELLNDGAYGSVTPETKEIFKNMNESNERLVKLIDSFLDITRLEQGRTKYDFFEHDLNALVDGVVKEFESRAKQKGLTLVWHPVDNFPKAFFDEEKIRNVVFNFIDNAIKYCESGSIKVEVYREGDYVAVKVRDCGIGFSKIDEANFFQKFYRGENVKGTNVNGTGLGLFVCAKFIEAHHGKVWAHSEGLGKGGEFGFAIPLHNG